MENPLAFSMARTASAEFAQLRSTAVANTSVRLQSKYLRRLACPASTSSAWTTPASVNTPPETCAESPAITLLFRSVRKSLRT